MRIADYCPKCRKRLKVILALGPTTGTIGDDGSYPKLYPWICPKCHTPVRAKEE